MIDDELVGVDEDEDRVTEIGGLEEVDRLEHPVALAVGLVALVLVLLIGVVALGSALAGDGEDATSGRPEQVVLPRAAGRPLAQAQAELERQGLIVEVVYDSNEIIPVDVVIDQEPIAGSRIEVGEQVQLRVSDGPAGIDVPVLTGLQGSEAVDLLQTVGLVGALENTYDETIRPGEVVNSSPAIGSRAPVGSTVVVRVSQGPAPRTVPEIVGSTVGAAVVALGRADLTVGTITEQFSDTQVPGIVVSSDPAQGTQAARDQPVALVVTASRLPVAVPDLVGLTRASAASVAKEAGVTATVRNQELPAGDTRIGVVVSQSPVANTRVANGAAVTINVGVLAVPTTTTTAPGATTVPGATTTTAPR
jgi:eukaryotic-like serine/threonine-protein kinase